jgi:calcineurin-like phosphoesterase family protein
MAIKRGFSCEEEQDELIVKNWNNVISKRDNVFLLGDITTGNSFS